MIGKISDRTKEGDINCAHFLYYLLLRVVVVLQIQDTSLQPLIMRSIVVSLGKKDVSSPEDVSIDHWDEMLQTPCYAQILSRVLLFLLEKRVDTWKDAHSILLVCEKIEQLMREDSHARHFVSRGRHWVVIRMHMQIFQSKERLNVVRGRITCKEMAEDCKFTII